MNNPPPLRAFAASREPKKPIRRPSPAPIELTARAYQHIARMQPIASRAPWPFRDHGTVADWGGQA